MTQDNTLTATPGTAVTAVTTEVPVDIASFRAELEACGKRITALEIQIQRRNDYQVSYAQQLFLRNLGQVNTPSALKAWEATEEQLKFLESKGIL